MPTVIYGVQDSSVTSFLAFDEARGFVRILFVVLLFHMLEPGKTDKAYSNVLRTFVFIEQYVS